MKNAPVTPIKTRLQHHFFARLDKVVFHYKAHHKKYNYVENKDLVIF